jgi:branched-subunit amino acid transport protein AzlD
MNNERLKDIAISIILFCVVLIIITCSIILVLNQFSPFKECENHNDSYMIEFGKKWFTCGELRAINTSISQT